MRRALAAATLLILAAPLAASLAACSPASAEAPLDRGVCWSMSTDAKTKKVSFHKVSENVSNLEHCAANLEAIRVKFLGMGGSHHTIDGAYQGVFIFVNREGIYSAPDLNKAPYLALVRTGDGRLVVPGAQSQQQ